MPGIGHDGNLLGTLTSTVEGNASVSLEIGDGSLQGLLLVSPKWTTGNSRKPLREKDVTGPETGSEHAPQGAPLRQCYSM
jgi:hypothetical protein